MVRVPLGPVEEFHSVIRLMGSFHAMNSSIHFRSIDPGISADRSFGRWLSRGESLRRGSVALLRAVVLRGEDSNDAVWEGFIVAREFYAATRHTPFLFV